MIQKRNQGFTIIELMLSIAFISFLLLSIALLAIQVGRMYQRGLTLQTINQSGREISDMMRRDFLQARAPHITTAAVSRGGEVVGGRLCLGDYSYVWNNVAALEKYAAADSSLARLAGSTQPLTLARVADPGGLLCTLDAAGQYTQEVTPSSTTQLLRQKASNDDAVVGIHTMTAERIIAPSAHLSQGLGDEALYQVRFVLGTGVTSEINTADHTCKPPNEADLEYCAINKFEIVARTNG
ncbi:MAG: hypothetical protein Q4A37_02710 [Candidatus Saccharibacteria bacterium]|nr:hypothetical protein [Candidatus Saccharibacteria bacterium]